jgi:hypothetical protein
MSRFGQEQSKLKAVIYTLIDTGGPDAAITRPSVAFRLRCRSSHNSKNNAGMQAINTHFQGVEETHTVCIYQIKMLGPAAHFA